MAQAHYKPEDYKNYIIKRNELHRSTTSTTPKKEQLNSAEIEQILAVLPNITGKKVLELGCGAGRFTKFLAQHAKEVVVVDFVDTFIEENKKIMQISKILLIVWLMSGSCMIQILINNLILCSQICYLCS